MTTKTSPRTSGLELDPEIVRQEVRRFLEEDVGTGDLTTERVVPTDAWTRGWIVAREPCVIAGMDLARAVFHELDEGLRFTTIIADGTRVAAGTGVSHLQGRAAPILTGERLALNLLQRLSGIATLTRQYVDAVAGTKARILDTRKTTPGLRRFEKYAVRTGGGQNHRAGLYDAILIKDNHVAIAGGVVAALQRATRETMSSVLVQIEVDSLDQLRQVLDSGAEAVLLDNMPPDTAAEAVKLIRNHPGGSACWIEASGGITLENVRAYAEAGVDVISVGALTHSARAVDIALDMELPNDPRRGTEFTES